MSSEHRIEIYSTPTCDLAVAEARNRPSFRFVLANEGT